jgi:hypothetical protein
MASASTQCGNKLLDKLFGGVDFDPATDYWLALYSAALNNDGSGGTELALTGGYGRSHLANNTTNFPGAAARETLNDAAFNYLNDGSAGDWLKAVAWALYDDETAGEIWTFGLLSPAVTIRAFQSRSFGIGDLIHTLK